MTARSLLRPARVSALLGLLAVGACGGGGDPVAPPPPAVAVSLSPATATVNAGATQSFTATVVNATSTAVTWSATGGQIAGSGASVTWTAPISGGSYTITATSSADPSKSASATVTVAAITIGLTPATITVDAGATQSFTATVANAIDSAVTWTTNGGSISGTGRTVSWRAPSAAGSYAITATSVADPSKAVTATATVAPIRVTLAPDTATLGAAASRTFTATITGSADSTIRWTASGGTVMSNGRTATWTAPITGGSYTLRATSVLDSAISATAQLSVTPVLVTLSPAAASLFRGQNASFTATVGGTAPTNQAVTWSSSCGSGTAASGAYTYSAPLAPGVCTVTATSVLDPSRSASATITVRPELLVTTTDDTNDGSCTFAHCSLREALLLANAAADADEILLGAASVMRPVVGVITLGDSLPTLRTPISIRGPGAAELSINADASMSSQRRVFTLTGGANVTVDGVTLRGGRAASGGGVQLDSGAVARLSRVVVTDNHALSLVGGGILVFGGSALVLEDTDVIGNLAFGTATPYGAGGGIAVAGGSSLDMRRGLVRDNVAHRYFGGGIFGSGSTLLLTDVRVEQNESYSAGGGIGIWDSAATLTMQGGVIRNNRIMTSAPSGTGGGILVGAGSLTASRRITLTMRDVLIESNAARTQGGGLQLVRNVAATLERLTVRGNTLGGVGTSSIRIGAGMYVGSLADVVLRQSTVQGNTLTDASGSADGGGGIAALALETPLLGSLLIEGSTIAGNSSSAAGGGLGVGGAQSVTVTNSTIADNSASRGGGVWAERSLALRNVTLADNRASVSAAGIGSGANGALTLANTLLARNRIGSVAQNCVTTSGGTIATLANNLSDDATCIALLHASDLRNTPSGLDTQLADNGGLTRTYRLLLGSAAINAGNPATCSPTDQRGIARVLTCDIGAVEFVPTGAVTAGAVTAGAVTAGAVPASTSRALRAGSPAVLRRGRAVRVTPERFVEGGLGPAGGRP
jgi:CSLREA domain-containing protein